MLAKIVRPFAKLMAFILNESGISFEKVIHFSYVVTLLTLAFFYISLVREPYYDVYKYVVVALVIFSAFVYELIIQVAKLEDQDRSVKLYWDRYMDLLIYIGLIAILGFAFVEVRVMGYYIFEPVFYFMLVLFIIGLVLMEWSRDEYLAPPSDYMDSRSTRLIIMAVFMFYGIPTFNFENMIFLGLLTVNALIYISLLLDIFKVMEFNFLFRLLTIPKNIVVFFVTKTSRFLFILTLYLKSSNFSLPSLRLPQQERPEGEPAPEDDEDKKADMDSDGLSTYLFTVVVNDYRNVPLENVIVTLIHIKSGIEEVGYTNEKGRMDFVEVVPAQYKIVLEGGGVKKEVHDRYISMDYGEVFTVQRSLLDLSVVVNQKGTTAPIPDARITLEQPGEKLSFKAMTNNLGIAYFQELPILDFAMTIIADTYNPYSRIISLMAENVISVSLSKKKSEIVDYEKSPLTPKIKKSQSYGADKLGGKKKEGEMAVSKESTVPEDQPPMDDVHEKIESNREEAGPGIEKPEIHDEGPSAYEDEKPPEPQKKGVKISRDLRIKEIQEKIGAVRGKIISSMPDDKDEEKPQEEEEDWSEEAEESEQEIMEETEESFPEPPEESEIMAKEIQEASLEGSALIEYGSGIKPGEIVIPIVREHLQNDRVVYVITTPARIGSYWAEFQGDVMEGNVKLINMTPSIGAPIANDNIIEISTMKLDDLDKIIENMPIGGLLVLEPLSSLIFNRGFDVAFNFIKKTSKMLSEEGLLFVCLVKKDNHNPPEIKKLENIFSNVGQVKDGSLVKIK